MGLTSIHIVYQWINYHCSGMIFGWVEVVSRVHELGDKKIEYKIWYVSKVMHVIFLFWINLIYLLIL